jgi:hypothetical protein
VKRGSSPFAISDQPGVREYQIISLFALGGILVIDLQQGNVLLSLLLVLVGILGMTVRLRLGPILFLIALGFSQWIKQYAWRRGGTMPLAAARGGLLPDELLFSLAVLAYLLAQCRLQGLLLSILPARENTGVRRFWQVLSSPTFLQPRPGRLVTPQEIGWFFLGLPPCALLAQGVWNVLFSPALILDLPVRLTRVVYLGWFLAVGALVVSALLDLQWQKQQPPERAALYLQDTLWRETRHEQRRLNRWIAWRSRKQ